MRINIILPSFPKSPSGGHKIVYEYANRLAALGNDIVIYHVMKVPFNKPYRPSLYLYINSLYKRHVPVSWFRFNPRIKFQRVYKIDNTNVRNADIILYTMSSMSFPVSLLSPLKGKKVNLIQGYETWIINDEKTLQETYSMSDLNIVVSDFIAAKVLEATGASPTIIYNATDFKTFNIQQPISKRLPHTVSMLYSEIAVKGSFYGIQALKLCKESHRDLQVEMFGTYPAPPHLPEWIHYHRNPQNLCELYNSTAIFLCPSIKEGWGLTATEAMACGCALVSTDVEGLTVFAHNGETALTCQAGNAIALANNLKLLLADNDMRMTIATRGNSFVQQFTWEQGVNKLLQQFNKIQAI